MSPEPGPSTDQTTGIALIAGPPAPNPPWPIAMVLVGLSLAAPYLFLKTGAPNLLLGCAVISLGLAAIIAVFGAARASAKRNRDRTSRIRARITPQGVWFYAAPGGTETAVFALADIAAVYLTTNALIVIARPSHPAPGRHVLMFSTLQTPRPLLQSAVNALQISATA